MRIVFVVLAIVAATSLVPGQTTDDPGPKAHALLERRCLGCHNPQLRTSGLVLATREAALEGGNSRRPALVPGRPDESLLLRRVESGEMPPDAPLPQEERELLRRWIVAGAPWTRVLATSTSAPKRAGRDWWSLQPLRRVDPPSPAGISEEWSRSAIDRFVYAKLKEKGLDPAPPADRRTLIRRVTFDLLGLPPTPDEVEAFVADPGPDSYAKLVDRLLASPHYGERWGRHWLDVVRFGESHGYEQNHLRDNAWPYRDYVIRAFNQDKPFNQFIVEQLAGDHAAPGDPAVEVATGFLVAGVHDTVRIANIEGEIQKRANDLDDMVSTTAAAFLGLTVGCARCHDHKFDPILQSDYYRMQAAFAGVEHGSRVLAPAEETKQRRVVEEPLRKRIEAIGLLLEALKIQAEPRVEAGQNAIVGRYRPPVDSRGTEERVAPVEARFVRMTIRKTLRRSAPALDEIEVWTAGVSSKNVARGARIKARSTRAMDEDMLFYRAEHLVDGDFDKIWISGEPNNGEITIELSQAARIDRIVWSRDRLGAHQGKFLSMVPAEYALEVSLDGHDWRKVADSEGRLPYDEAERQELFLTSVLSVDERKEWDSLREQRQALEARLAALPKLPTAYIGMFRQPAEPSRIARRGNPVDPGDVVQAGSLSAFDRMLPGLELEPGAPEGKRRLELARWIADDRNALTARVLANRVWLWHFGRGIVDTPSDFGSNGALPSHPELLDWLARRVQEHGWRVKLLHREILLSAAYRQSSRFDRRAASEDHDAVYLWRFPPRRLEAEEVRDAILAVSGRLDPRMGGPGFRLYRYTVDNVATYGPLDQYGPETYRRSVYHQAARSVKADLLGPYDCPDSSLPAPKRVVTTSPLQALSLLNNSFAADQSRFLAARLEQEAGPHPRRQVERAFRLAYGRDPQPEEIEHGLDLVRDHGLWILCRVLLNANEFVYVF